MTSMNLKKASILPIPMYYLETAKGYTGKENVLKAGNESTRYKRAPLREINGNGLAMRSAGLGSTSLSAYRYVC
jgi:hypothetical protein